MNEFGYFNEELNSLPQSLFPLENPYSIKAHIDVSRYKKLNSIIQIQSAGLPTLPGFVIKNLSLEVLDYLKNWNIKLNSKRLSLRFDSPNPEDHKKLLGSNPTISELSKMRRFLSPPVIGIVLAENDRFNQDHSVLTHFSSEYLRFEIVGPGFDAADITRGNVSPHEYFLIRRKGLEDHEIELNPSDVIKHFIIDHDSYSQSRSKRYGVIYSILKKGLGRSVIPKDLTKRQSLEIENFLRQRNSEVPKYYPPLNYFQFGKLYGYVRQLDTFSFYFKERFGFDVRDKVLSASFLKKHGLVFWDLYGADKYTQS